MTDFTFISANDIHISDNPPRSRTDNFKESILDKLRQIALVCNKVSADAVLIAGDLYNLKNPARNSHALNQDLIRVFKTFGCPIYMIEGNHDITANSLNSILEQPLGVLFADGTLQQLRHEIIEKNGFKISIVGSPYKEIESINDIILEPKGDCIYQIGLLHLYASPKSGMLFKERIYGYDELTKLSPDLFVIGHYHKDQGIVDDHGKIFINIGSLSRGSLSEEDINHQPQIGYIKISVDESTRNVFVDASPVKLKVKPPEEVFDLKKREEEKKEQKEIEIFVDKLVSDYSASDGADQDGNDFETVMGSMSLVKEVKDRVMHYIQEASVR